MRVSLLRKLGAGLALCALSVGTFAQSKGFDLVRMDREAQACTDFYQFANGNWDKTTQIPSDRSRYGSFDILADNNRDILRDILEASAKNTKAAAGSNEQLVGDYYAACMDEAAIEAAGTKPLEPYFKKIDGIKDAKDLQKVVAQMHKAGIPAVFGFGAGADLKNSTMTIANMGQGGLSLPNRDYYTKDDEKSKQTRDQFVQHVTNMFVLLGEPQDKAAANAQTILKLQTQLANASKSPVDLRNPENRYNKISVADAQKTVPNFDFNAYFTERGAPKFTEFNIGQPDFFKTVNTMLTEVPVEDWKTYLRWMTLNSAAPLLPKKFVDENFNFYSRTLAGVKEQQPRWRRCVAATDGAVGEALGQEYVKRAFKPEAKKRMDEMITNLFAAFRERLAKLDWMGEDTRQQALAKLNAFGRKIGYPDKLRGYQGLKIDRKSFFANSSAVGQFEIARNLKDIGQPVDKSRWGMTPPTVNAYYNALFNEIAFPAGILQPPFFNFEADDAINYGGIGAVIGHEITHGFDDQGSRFDAQGNLRMWWTAEDRKRFEERASCVDKQFSSYEVLPSLFMNGKLGLGENIADLGGLTVAYQAYLKSLEGKPRPANIDGFTPEQRFFLGWAQVWASKYTPEATRLQVQNGPHAVSRFRVNGPLSNLPIFAEAYNCKTGDKMVREERCQIW
jgi:putative endopeptidase